MYTELRRQAASQLRRETRLDDLQPTALVNEAYFKLVNLSRVDLNGRTHFMGIAGRMMREVLVDEARRVSAKKRDRDLRAELSVDLASNEIPVHNLVELNELIVALEQVDPQYAAIVDARVFAGMTVEETAQSIGMSTATVKRKWKVAVAWLLEHASGTEKDA